MGAAQLLHICMIILSQNDAPHAEVADVTSYAVGILQAPKAAKVIDAKGRYDSQGALTPIHT